MSVPDPARPHDHACEGCGYSLRGLSPGSRCPECGRQPLAQRPLVNPDAGTLDVDLACAACGYNLRGLDPRGRCPECSAHILKSLSRARAFTPSECRRIARKLAWALWAELAEIPGLVLALVVGSPSGSAGWVALIVGFLVLATAAAARAVFTLQVMQLAATDQPAAAGPMGDVPRRRPTDVGWLPAVPAFIHAASVATACFFIAASHLPYNRDDFGTVVGIAIVVAVGSSAICGLVLLVRAEHIAARAGWPRYVKSLENATVTTLIVFILGFPLLGLGPLAAYVVYQSALWRLSRLVRSRGA